MLQKHYDSINTQIMGLVLTYYYDELDYWKSCTKLMNNIDNIREFE